MKQASQRQLRVAEQIRHALFDLFQRDSFHDPDLEKSNLLTVSEVRISPDLKNATVFVSALQSEEEDQMIQALNRAAKYIKKEVSDRAELRFTPQMYFKSDHGYDYATDINSLLQDEQIQKDVRAAKAREDEDHE